MGDHLQLLLLNAAQAWDRADLASRDIAERGVLIHDRFNQLKPNPACGVEAEDRRLFASIMKLIGDLGHTT